MPAGSALGLIENGGAEHVMPVAEDIGPDVEPVADHALDRITTAIELGIESLDDNPRASLWPACGSEFARG